MDPKSGTETHAMCSMNCLRGRHAAARAPHCYRASDLRATCHPAPCASKCKRPSCPSTHSPPHSPSLALWCCTRAPGRGRHGCRRELELGRHCSSSSKRLAALNPLPPASPPSTWPRALLPGFPSPPVRVAVGAVAAADACARGQANPARLQPN